MGTKNFNIGNIKMGLDQPMFIIAGPCVIESQKHCIEIASKLVEIGKKTGINFIFKASFDKANRTSIDSYRGPGIEEGLKILANVKKKTSLPVMTDIHLPDQAERIAQSVDCIQIPAFLCRQTDLLVASAKTGLPVNIKKGQFVSPAEMKNAVEKVRASGNDKIMLTERGTFFGYNRLVNDMSAIEQMKQLGCPVIFDATHSTQQPGGFENSSAGNRKLAPVLAKAAIAAGANGLFLEIHTDPENAKCDSACVIPIEWVEELAITCNEIFKIIRK